MTVTAGAGRSVLTVRFGDKMWVAERGRNKIFRAFENEKSRGCLATTAL
jgi:hypothetical protein